MKKITVFTIVLISLLTIFLTTALGSESKAKHTNIKVKKETKHTVKTEHREKSTDANRGEKKQGEGKSEHEAAWRIFGWQTIFASLSVLFYIIVSLTLLPKIAAKELGSHH